MWPASAEALVSRQLSLAELTPGPWDPPPGPLCVAGCWVAFERGQSGRGAAGDPAYAAVVALRGGRVVEERVVVGAADAPYEPGMLALRLGALAERVAGSLSVAPDVLMVDATSRDHPRRAGLALHLGAELDLPTIGVTHRPLLAEGEWPGDERGARRPLRIGREVVGCWLRTRPGTRPLAVHPGWRLDLETAVEVVLESSRWRTPEPLRLARQRARKLRAGSGESGSGG